MFLNHNLINVYVLYLLFAFFSLNLEGKKWVSIHLHFTKLFNTIPYQMRYFPLSLSPRSPGEQTWEKNLPGGLRSSRTSVCSIACRKSLSSVTVQPFSPNSFSKHKLGLPSGSKTLREHCSKSRQLQTTDLIQVNSLLQHDMPAICLPWRQVL